MKARPYQVLLHDIATKKNTIIHLPTGSGKTFIACELIKKFRDDLQKPWGKGGKRTFFIVNTVPLVIQQKKFIENLCPVGEVGSYSSENNVDYWNKAKWEEELISHQVLVMTCQILLDMLTHVYIKIEDINLLIFDECHHAVEDHPMRLVMKHFEDCPTDKQPRVLGLTATLLNANVSIGKVETTLRVLETTFHASIATVNELGEVLSYSTNPTEQLQYYNKPVLTAAAIDAITKLQKLIDMVMSVKLPRTKPNLKLQPGQEDITSDPKKTVKAVKNMITSMIMFIQELGAYGGSVGILAYVILLERLKRKVSVKEEELFYKIVITHSNEARMILLKHMENETGYEKIVKHSSQKFLQLLRILKEYNPDVINQPGVLLKINQSKKPLSAIIFAQQRFTAKILFNLLKDVKEANPKDFGFLKHDFIVGFNIDPTKSTREQHYLKKSSEKALLMFGNKELNCVISTSVLEEGVDIQQCLLVVRYDVPMEYRSYIQSKGRCRSSDSNYVLLVDAENKDQFLKNYCNFQRIEHHICKLLVGNTDEREAPSVDEIQENFYDDDEIPPYVTANGNRLSSVSAISLLHRYCNNLPHDYFTSISPMWYQENVKDQKGIVMPVVTVIMPIGCPIKEEIKGDPLPNKELAKRSAALNACIKLHKAGELDYATLLPHKYASVNYDSEDISFCFPNWPADGGDKTSESLIAGTKKYTRKYKIQFPSCLNAVSEPCYYLHIIETATMFEKPKESRDRALYDFLQSDDGFGILTQSKLPKLCNFPAFTKVGEAKISVDVNYAVIKLDKKLFDIVKRFHYFIFDQVLAVAKKFLVFEGIQNCMYVVPVKRNDGYDIDWATMREHKTIRPVKPPPDTERMSFSSLTVAKEKYLNSVVTPWYRGSILPERYIVSNVLEYKTPESQFDSEAFYTYADYYLAKYNLSVLGQKDQPLLEVRNISTRMNCLLPRAATINTFTDKQQRLVSASQGDEKPKGFPELFVPEFCIKYDFPGVLWYKAKLLPSIIHRINHAAGEGTSNSPKMSSLKDSLYQLQMKKINKEYPWDEKMEPVDIERNLSSVTAMDVACYDEFASAPLLAPLSPRAAHAHPPPHPPPHPPRLRAHALQPPAHKYEDKLKILEKTATGRGPELRDILSALTTTKCHDTFNLETAETLGDSFLKFAASLYLYHKFPKLSEGQLTNIKCRLISNRNLFYAGQKINLGGRMKVEQFSPRKDFLVPGFFAPAEAEQLIEAKKIRPTLLIGMSFPEDEVLSGVMSGDSLRAIMERYNDSDGATEPEPERGAQNSMQCYVHSQAVADKSVADCVEAIVGTYLASGGVLAAVKVLEWLKVLPPQDKFATFLHKRVSTVINENQATVGDVEFLLNGYRTDIENILGYRFNDPSFLLHAMSHASYIRNRLTGSYERLEFLGDAILDFLVTSHIYENSDKLKPGEITDLRSALVNNVTFAAFTVRLGLHKYLCSELNPTLSKAILNFVEHQRENNHNIIVDVLYLIDEEDCQVAEYVDVPKVLSDIFEALVGAIYLDSGGDLQTVWSIVYKIMHKEIYEFSMCVPKQPVRILYENIHACPSFGDPTVIDPDIPRVMVPVSFTKKDRITVYGIGRNKSQAKRAAAKVALKVLCL
ncbi:hypothetical protein O3G_MSEX005733 [Manduca sexta]|uniref:Dicer-2 n=1 Tax=Manduca sexta TaxID=7130 RepID=A0A921Z1Y6_MANSE|nr:hypothetical protein O3G_MSEX005733 [Manduca sexta]